MLLVKGGDFFLDSPQATLTKLTAGLILTMLQTSGRHLKKNLLVLNAAILSLALLLLTGCMTTPVSIAPSTTPITSNDLVTEIGPASGSSWGGFVFPFFLIGGGHMIQPALDRALKKTGADALVDVKVETHSYFFLLVTLHRTEVYGTAVKITKGGAVK